MPVEVDREQFEHYVAAAVEGLPPEFLERLSNVDFSVEDWARPEDHARTGSPRGTTLLGVYRGVPLNRRGGGYHMVAPDHIVIFRGPLQRIAADEPDLAERIAHVVRHEIAHHFGISDERLREIDAY
jgi:predicted Zn-dependent protease with MMP-like domain